jgi:hypothetical protein
MAFDTRLKQKEVVPWARQATSLLNAQQQGWVARHKWALAPLWSEGEARPGEPQMARRQDAEFFRAVFQDTAFTNRFDRQRP